jgi:hypothetical protein
VISIADDAMGNHTCDSLRLRALFVLVLTIAIGAVCRFGCEKPISTVSPVGVERSRRIMIALAQYLETNGRIPFDERGPDYALYKLHDLIDADQFQLRESATIERPRWDPDSRRLVGGDVVYINRPLTESEGLDAIIFMGTPTAGEKWTYVGHLGSGAWIAAFAATPGRQILGSFRTVDDLYVVGSALFEDLAATHVLSGHSWSTTSDSEHGLISATVADRELRYQFVDGRIVQCEIQTPRGTIREEFRTDSLGQIIGATRSPANWRQALGVVDQKR